MNIKLVKDTIDTNDINELINWLKTNPNLTKGELTPIFEKMWSNWLGCKYSVYVNSGSSANLAAIYSLILSGRLKNNKIIVPAVSWVTTVSPAIQLGLNPIMCDCDIDNLGLDINHLKLLIEKEKPSVLILVHVLGFPNHMNEITKLCKENDIILIEDTCEAIGSMYNNQLLGTFGELSTFSFYFGHHISTIEGGMISTNDEDLYHLLLSIRSHGWDRDLPQNKQTELRKKYNIDDFKSLYTFYYPGFNLRSTDLQAFIGIQQMNKINEIVKSRNENYLRYKNEIKNNFWIISPPNNSYISNFSYPIITKNINNLVKALSNNNIDCRPLICGSINEHPFWFERYGKSELPNSKLVHTYGIYIPNNHQITNDELDKIIETVNNNL
ncbi:MAG: DegT/DnrJ/EryC1/StrS family aminotransferase [Proteobacteria bacterium]|nr:DegT/DnrJ/EryC1/StrS family aminotransferase [Pseudomonadota bacterium]